MRTTGLLKSSLLVILLGVNFGQARAQRHEGRIMVNPNIIFGILNRQTQQAILGRGQRNSEREETVRPNIIFILTDDHRWDALGIMGNKIIKTPNLDALARKGTLFKKAYVTTSICCVSRASILTGQYASRHKINNFSTCFNKKALDKTYPALLKNAGYKLGFIGKFGIDEKRQPDSLFDYWASAKEEQPVYEMVNKSGKIIHHTDSVGKDIKQFLSKFADQGPFCLSVSFKAPHELDGRPPTFPVQERYKGYYQNVVMPEPVTADPKYWNSFPEWFKSDKNIARERWKPLLSTPELRQETTRNYYRLISGVDEVVGDMMVQLKQLKLEKNTVIIFMGDNGFSLGEHGLEGKWFGYEESIRVPLIISGGPLPRKMKREKTNRIALNIDIAPTILSLAGIPIPGTIQGKDLIGVMTNKVGTRKDFFYEHTYLGSPWIPKVEGVVSENMKYMKFIEHNYEEFYNTKKDPRETANLIKVKKNKMDVDKMRNRYAALRKAAR